MKRYVVTFVALMALTGLTFGLSFVDLGEWSVVLALSIALAKAVLVAFFFMHLIEQRTSARVTALVAIVLTVAFIGLITVDVSTRSIHVEPEPVVPAVPGIPTGR